MLQILTQSSAVTRENIDWKSGKSDAVSTEMTAEIIKLGI